MSRRKRYARYAGFLLLGAAVVFAEYESVQFTQGIGDSRTGDRNVDVQSAGAGPIYAPNGDVVENRCSLVRAPGGLFYFDPENPGTTACIHPPDEDGYVGPLATGTALPALCRRTPDRTVWCVERAGAESPEPVAITKAYEAGYLPRD